MSVYEVITQPDGSRKVIDAISRRPICDPAEAEAVLVTVAVEESRPLGSSEEIKTKCGAN